MPRTLEADVTASAITRRRLLDRAGVALVGIAGGSVILQGCGGAAGGSAASSTVAAGGGKQVPVLNWALSGEPVGIDYVKAYDYSTNLIVANITEPLLRVTEQGELAPNVAESWEQVDPHTVRIVVRSGIKLHDGSTLTAEDVAYSLDRHRDPDVGSFLATFYERVASVRVTGPHEVTVKLSQPDSLFPYALATMAGAVASKAFIERHGSKVGGSAVGIVGTGPYRFVSWTKGQQVVMERFDDYWNRARPLKVKRFVGKIILDQATIVQALSSGELDGVFGANLSGTNVKAAQRIDRVSVYRVPSYQVQVVSFNTQRAPMSDARVRQALSYAIDKRGLLESTWGGIGRADIKSPAPPALWTFERETFQQAYDKLPGFPQDIDQAKRLIHEAGATGAKMSILVGLPFEADQAVAVQAAGKEIGLDISVDKVELSQKVAAEFTPSKTRDYDAIVHQWGSDIPDPAGNIALPFDSQNLGANVSLYDNPAVDRLIARQRATTDQAERARLLTQAQAKIVPDQPWIVLFSPDAVMVLRDSLGGYQMRPLWYWDSFVADISGR